MQPNDRAPRVQASLKRTASGDFGFNLFQQSLDAGLSLRADAGSLAMSSLVSKMSLRVKRRNPRL
jgi:hypothetical protein